MIQVVDISLGQKAQLTGQKWSTKTNKNRNGQDVESFANFNPRTVTMIGDAQETHFVSVEERETLIADYQWLKNRPLVDYNPEPEELP